MPVVKRRIDQARFIKALQYICDNFHVPEHELHQIIIDGYSGQQSQTASPQPHHSKSDRSRSPQRGDPVNHSATVINLELDVSSCSNSQPRRARDRSRSISQTNKVEQDQTCGRHSPFKADQDRSRSRGPIKADRSSSQPQSRRPERGSSNQRGHSQQPLHRHSSMPDRLPMQPPIRSNTQTPHHRRSQLKGPVPMPRQYWSHLYADFGEASISQDNEAKDSPGCSHSPTPSEDFLANHPATSNDTSPRRRHRLSIASDIR